jgi:hypothetical protein
MKVEKMVDFDNVILTISDQITSFTVSVEVKENCIFIRSRPGPHGMHEEPRLQGTLCLMQDDLTRGGG